MSRRTQETLANQLACRYGDFTLFVCAFHRIPVDSSFAYRVPTTPYRYGLGFFPFARRYSGNHCCFLFLRLLRCFSSPGFSPFAWMTGFYTSRVPPFGHPRVVASSAARRGFSQPGASFFIQEWQGILRTPFLA